MQNRGAVVPTCNGVATEIRIYGPAPLFSLAVCLPDWKGGKVKTTPYQWFCVSKHALYRLFCFSAIIKKIDPSF